MSAEKQYIPDERPALEQGLERLVDGFVCGARQQSQQLAVALDEAAQDAGDRKRPVAMRHGRQDLTRQLLGKEHGAPGLATWAKFPLSATEGDEVFSVSAVSTVSTALRPKPMSA